MWFIILLFSFWLALALIFVKFAALIALEFFAFFTS
jgi:hypothetical protein